ncbi:DUF732 domain-containing protein [Mycobacterium simiae]|uniref:DUF732 domain-containing protein n=1 Tax=Mycobacterium simiae TaxID=1784 RepID=UPI0005C9A6DA|nr:DUF732 domain-containing protein [Mycobacterium simiae]PLV44592.1 hypothetical protein X011_26440 [Mycobacterium tuberculosis variant microti OV254]BBX39603.1 hypothetical protein MSIM_10540 [Mycobacterium simiae]
MKVPTIITGIAWALPLAAAMVPSITLPAHAEITCPNRFVPPTVNADCYFLYMMARDNIHANSQEDLIRLAHIACADMAADRGADPVMDEVPILQRANPAVTVQKAALFAGIAAAAYCPQVVRR